MPNSKFGLREPSHESRASAGTPLSSAGPSCDTPPTRLKAMMAAKAVLDKASAADDGGGGGGWRPKGTAEVDVRGLAGVGRRLMHRDF